MNRRAPALAVVAVALTGIVAVGASAPAPSAPSFSTVGAEWMPAAPQPSGLTSTWFCPGVPASGEEGVGGEVVTANSGDAESWIRSRGWGNGTSMIFLMRPGCAVMITVRSPISSASSMECVT